MAHIFRVGELTRAIREVVAAEFPFVFVRGQVSNLSRPSSGHIYFTLKDPEAALAAVWFKGARGGSVTAAGDRYNPVTGEILEPDLAGRLADGMEVLCAGRLTVYPPRGVYQLVVEMVEELGAGKLHLEFEALKRDLASLGYFDASRKRLPPVHPGRVALVTAASGAAVRDFIRVGRERGHGCKVLLYDVPVQGEAAPARIAEALERIGREGFAQVAVLIRGGGSIEDLWAFNTRAVADAVFHCPVPVVCGVGHEVDVTIADLVADVRAATPSHAAQLLWPERRVYVQRLDDLETAAREAASRLVAKRADRLAHLARGLAWLSPENRLERVDMALSVLAGRLARAGADLVGTRRERLKEVRECLVRSVGPGRGLDPDAAWRRVDGLADRLAASAKALADGRENVLERAVLRLAGLDPRGPLARGYSLVTLERTGTFLRRAVDAAKGDKLRVMVYEGLVRAEVTGVAAAGDGAPDRGPERNPEDMGKRT
ncbi:exodeoxyribonuclease VII large subunit [Desulfolutivibrio sulfoxidireducens]|uniref:exodeoxyribonuclease VII large subunit n=1 Tax=Desulfolutivibrio sulfoxidireducens TaxID=2773299 RepID=UPI00159D2869|nr:exodeoxyribonuclease VII large subunit [Desulfolutivibrio sulfoxidireducens]QLA15555.1 exodeoxyribonuclease VII large subunit [Desulfolutivibrio sulfoxidireducens]QLA19155.1 exodeoxyribonuclease VII large subunit [Desulfolutivibrio sulfoxidireducens]